MVCRTGDRLLGDTVDDLLILTFPPFAIVRGGEQVRPAWQRDRQSGGRADEAPSPMRSRMFGAGTWEAIVRGCHAFCALGETQGLNPRDDDPSTKS